MTPAERRETLIAYLKMKVADGDWHGVQDAASDLRDLEAAHPAVRQPHPLTDPFVEQT